MTRHTRFGLVVLAVAAFACGGDDGTTDNDTTTTDNGGTQDHRILVTSTAITGQQGNILLVTGPGNTSRLCAAIDADPFTLTATALTEPPPGDNPCGPATAEVRFADGSHALTASVFAPGSQTPEATTAATAVVAGADVTVQLDGSKLSEGASVGSPGRILVASTAISGRQGKVLLVSAAGGRLCANIDADPWTLAATPMTEPPNSGDPCGENTPEATFQGGDVVVTGAVYTGGSMTPEATTQGIAAVDGDVTVTLDGAALSAD